MAASTMAQMAERPRRVCICPRKARGVSLGDQSGDGAGSFRLQSAMPRS